MMLHRLKKTISLLLVLALMLVPLEFAFAHQGPVPAGQMMQVPMEHNMAVYHHDAAAHDHQADNMKDHASQCDGKGLCKNCVYCSPALSSMVQIQLDKPALEQLVTFIVTEYSIDLPVDIRPPKQL